MGTEKISVAVVCGGIISDLSFLKSRLSSYNFIIAADSGYDYCKKIKIEPNVIIGDLDSVGSQIKSGIKTIKFPTKKDKTDFALTLDYCLNNNFNNVDVYGATGGRTDHTIAAIFTIKDYLRLGLKAKIIDENTEIFCVNDYCKIKKDSGYYSVFALENNVKVTLKGFLYPLNDYLLECCSSLGVSNEITDDFAEVITNGTVAIIHTKK